MSRCRALVTSKPVVIDAGNLASYSMPPQQRSCPAWNEVPQS